MGRQVSKKKEGKCIYYIIGARVRDPLSDLSERATAHDTTTVVVVKIGPSYPSPACFLLSISLRHNERVLILFFRYG